LAEKRFATESEELFADYLERVGYAFEYEPSAREGERNPDFSVDTPSGVVVCEVTDLHWFVPPREGSRVGAAGWLDSYGAIRRKLQDKHKQGRHLKGRQPYVVVLRFVPSHPASQLIVPGAMYGDVAISIPIDPQGGPPPDVPARNVFTSGGRLQPERLTTISAVAVLEVFNPTKAAVERRIDELTAADATFEEAYSVAEAELAKPDFDENARVGRLDGYHNIYAADPRLPRGTFAGRTDREIDLDGSVYTEVYRGDRFDIDVPR